MIICEISDGCALRKSNDISKFTFNTVDWTKCLKENLPISLECSQIILNYLVFEFDDIDEDILRLNFCVTVLLVEYHSSVRKQIPEGNSLTSRDIRRRYLNFVKNVVCLEPNFIIIYIWRRSSIRFDSI